MTHPLPEIPINSIWKYKHSRRAEFYIVVKIVYDMITPTGTEVDAVFLRNMLTGKFDDSCWEYYGAMFNDYKRLDNV